jgi:hypothetical protein
MVGQWEKLFTPSTPFLMTPSSGESIGLAGLRIMRVFQANRSSTFVWRGFPRDFFLVANNLGDSVAFNLESANCAGFPAIYGRQPLYFQDPTFAARAAVPPPKHSDSLQAVPLPEVQTVSGGTVFISLAHRSIR